MKKITLFICSLFLFAGCEKDFDNIIEPASVNYVFNAPVVPASVTYSVSPTVVPTISITGLPDGSEVWFDVVYLNSGTIINSKILMNDNGQSSTANTKVFSGSFTFASTAYSGKYELSFYVMTVAKGGDETTTKVALKTIDFTGVPLNEAPVISDLSLPTSIDANTDFNITIKVSDANGLSDITGAWLTMTDPSGYAISTKVYLYDDGSVSLVSDEFGGTNKVSGDVTAGDGTFSRKRSFNSTAAKGDWTFTLQAKDNSNAYSNTITQKMTLR